MRIVYTLTKDEVSNLKYIKRHLKKLSIKGLIGHSIEFLWQIYYLLDNGYKLYLVDKDGNRHILGLKEEEDNDGKKS